MIRRRPVDARPKGISSARAGGTHVGVAVVAVDAPGMKNPLMIKQLMAGPADMIHDLVAPFFLQRFAHARSDVVEYFVPGRAFPFAFAALANAFQRIANPFGVGYLIEGRRSFGAVSAAAAGMLGIPFETANAMSVLFDKTQQSARRLAIETDRRNDLAMLLDFARPLRGIVFDPIVPFLHGRISCQTAARGFQAQRIGIERLPAVIHASIPYQLSGKAWPALIQRWSYIQRPKSARTGARTYKGIGDPMGIKISPTGTMAPRPTTQSQKDLLNGPRRNSSPARTASSAPCFMNSSLKIIAKLTNNETTNML